MKTIDQAKMRARKSVAVQIRIFIAALMGQFKTTPEEVLRRAQSEQLIDEERRKDGRTAAE